MIGRIVTTGGALLPVVGAAGVAAATPHAAVEGPTIWVLLGYPFEAAGMVGALFACSAARFYIGAGNRVRRQYRWSLDIPVSAMALAVSAALVVSLRPAPFTGLMIGAGVGMLGEGIFKLAERYVSKAVPSLSHDDPPTPTAG